MDASNFLVMDRQPGGCTGTISIGLIGDATETWTLVADGYNYTTEDVRGSNIFDEVYTTFHAQNPRLRMMPWEITQDKDAPQLFIVTLKWTSDTRPPATPARPRATSTTVSAFASLPCRGSHPCWSVVTDCYLREPVPPQHGQTISRTITGGCWFPPIGLAPSTVAATRPVPRHSSHFGRSFCVM